MLAGGLIVWRWGAVMLPSVAPPDRWCLGLHSQAMIAGCPCSDRRRIGRCFESCCVAGVNMDGRWEVYKAADKTVHVVPVDDWIQHILSDGCPCGPACEPVLRDDGSNGWMYTHHSADGRDQRE